MKFKVWLGIVAGILPLVLVAIVLFLALYSWPAMHFNGPGFVVRDVWNLGNLYADPITVHGTQIQPGASYGILFLIVGTLSSTLIALLLAVPVGVGAAIFLAEAVPDHLRIWISFFVELLMAIPSVVFGLWGYVVVIPFLGRHLFPLLARTIGAVIPFFAGPTGSGYGLLTAGVVLSLMIVPIIAATLRDALVNQPTSMREAALALGATRFEALWRVTLPGARKTLIGATFLALGRALGETMAVLMVSGNALNYLPHNLYDPISTMAAFIVSQLDSALQDPTGLAVRSLAEIALVLSIISILVNAMARLILVVWGNVQRTMAV
ncbi:MAG TPA: phosphate ABC transporter permease subunit PstC [Steroidobacteraceae bacterium]|nr:phosphate ABC transporter permease subunit PstC [Steroidobacteraceae bacterium]